MADKQKLQELSDKLEFLIQTDKTVIDISKIEQLLGELIDFRVICMQSADTNNLIWTYTIYPGGLGTAQYNRLSALKNELKYYLSQEE